MKPFVALALAASIAAPASAEDKLRDLCPDRPGLDTPACTVDTGHLQVEFGIGDWTLDRQSGSRTDTIGVGDLALRYGVTGSTELRFDWTAFNHARTRDKASGTIDHINGAGDVTIGLKQNLRNPDGSGFALAVLPQLSLPTGKDGIGAGDWGAGLLVPVSYGLNSIFSLALTPELDAAVDGDGEGRHLAFGSAIGLQAKLGEKAGLSAELQAIRDRDPAGHSTQALAGLSLSYQPDVRAQIDIGANAGLTRNSPDIEVYLGVTRKF